MDRPKYTDAEMLDAFFLARRLARWSCPVCGLIVSLAVTGGFYHLFSPQDFHRCRSWPR